MVIRVARRVVVVSITALALLVTSGAPALAGTPSPSSTAPPTFVEYTGGLTEVTDDGAPVPGTFPSTIRVDCSSGDCLLTGTTVFPSGVWEIEQGERVALVDGRASGTLPAYGSQCTAFWIGAGSYSITASGTGIVAVRHGPGSGGVINCPDGSSEEWVAFTATITATVSAGDPCVLFRTCQTPTSPATAAPIAAGGSSGSSAAHGFSSPGVLSTLPTVADALRPANAAWAAALTVILAILVALPSHLLNTAVEQGTERVAAWRRRVRPSRPAASSVEPVETSDAAAAPERPVRLAGWPLAAAGVLAASLISSFVDPSFGFDGGSVRTFLSILVSFLLDAVAGWFLLIWLVRRTTPTATARFRFAPATLLIVLAAVVFTRVTGFQPGIVFGLVAGVAFGTIVATADKAKQALLTLGYGLAIAVLGWIGYSLLSTLTDPGGAVLFVQETLSSIAVGGIAALPIALIPLRGLTGYEVFRWNRLAWAIAYGVGLFGFFFVLMPFPFAWKGVPLSIGVWIGLYLLYAVLAVGAWLLLARPWERQISESTAEPAATP